MEGIFSGTLSYIFNNFVEGTSFSEIVAEAKAAGYTEPDPRDDLAGMDVARKVTILARCVAEALDPEHAALIPAATTHARCADPGIMEAVARTPSILTFHPLPPTRALKPARSFRVL